ncbi:UDP-3-O-(3-hydroxymyristoyl)glucosamine N-acyltransferase [uncultured Algimonas sp.]|uniref:UDP-3-O-(3-hydroxymyristoyl)glucosamine N-acyltransferase n=1 Tax=uncultured Algimonas sp. TaxID=1547920 RepID=UPI00260DF553|nr:UDP-3-O-(3-hydroxymyristoyl)glucosamine N-acyltransferase [uncultured Algimonas sp.]
MIDPRFYRLRSQTMTVSELCARLDLAAPDGSFGETPVLQPAALAGSVSGDLAFLESKRHLASLEGAGASACFVKPALADTVAQKNIVPIQTEVPKYHLARATMLLVSDNTIESDISAKADIHPTVHIGPGVVIGDDVRIGPHSVVTNAVIGRGVTIGACTVIGGEGFGVVVGPDGDMLPVPHVGRVMIGENVRIGSNVCVDRGQLGDTRISDGCQIDNLVQIAHNCVLEQGCILAGRVGLSGSCHIGTGVMMGGSAGLADHITVGDGARLAAFAGVMHDVPAGETWSGIPAMPIRDHMKIVAQSKRSIRK